MAQQTINVGTAPNDGTGTPLRTAFQYTNSNFSELYTAVGPSGNNIVVPGNATITGDLTVDTNTLKVDSANDRVGVGTASPAAGAKLGVLGATSVSASDYIGSSTWAARFIGSSNGAASGISFLTNSAFGLPTPASLHALPVADYRSALVATYSADPSGAGYFAVNRFNPTASTTSEHYKIDNAGVATWSNVGGVAGTAMTLNSTGLGVGKVPASNQSKVQIYQALGTSLNGALHITDDATTSFVFNNTSSGVSSIWTSGALTFSTGSNAYSTNGARMTLDASGRLFVGTTSLLSVDEKFAVKTTNLNAWATTMSSVNRGWLNRQSDASGGVAAYFEISTSNTNVGSIVTSPSGTSYLSVSDYRLKESVQPLVGGLTRISALKPSIYKWKIDGSNGEGFLAHELAQVVPSAVSGEKDAVNEDGSIKAQQVDLSKVVPILVAAIQELTARVQTIETR